MSRPAKIPYEDEVTNVVEKVQSGLCSWEELKIAATQWSLRNYKYRDELAKRIDVAPGHLTLVALLTIEHPLIVSPGRGIKWGFMRCAAEILAAELYEIPVEIPIGNSFHSPHEWNLEESKESHLSTENGVSLTGKTIPSTK